MISVLASVIHLVMPETKSRKEIMKQDTEISKTN